MKKIGIALLAVTLLLFTFGCSGGEKLPTEEVERAFVVSFSSVLMASMGAAFGADMEGVTMDEETQAVSLDGFDITELGTEYTSISGEASGTGESMSIDVTLEGGKVKSISYTVSDFQDSDSIKTTVKANGKEYDLDMTAEDMHQ